MAELISSAVSSGRVIKKINAMIKSLTTPFVNLFRATVVLSVSLPSWAETVHGQGVGIGTTTFSPVSDAALELRSTSSVCSSPE